MRKAIIGIILGLVMIFSLIGNLNTVKVQAAGLDGWANQIKITIDQSKIDANLTNYPVLINLSAASGINDANLSAIFTELGSDANRKKIAVTTADGVTQCYVEIEKWDTASRQASLWVRVPSISASVDTDLYLYYDRNQPDNNTFVGDKGSSAATRVWDNNYRLVLHLNDNRDSTQFGRDGSYKNGTPQTAAGVGGSSSLYFNRGPYLEIPSTNDFSVDTNGGRLVISFWFSPASSPMTSGEYTHFISKIDSGKGEWAFRFYNNVGSSSGPFNASNRYNTISFYYWNPSGGEGAGARWDRGPLPANTWVFVTAVADYVGDRFVIYGWPSNYREGKTAGSGGYWQFSGTPVIKPKNGGAPVRLGYCPGRPAANARIDEFRISNALRSDAWVKADFYSQSDQLVRYTVNTVPRPTTLPTVTTLAATGITSSAATLSGNLTSLGSSSSVNVSFEWGTSQAYGNSINSQIKTGTGSFSASLTGLAANTTYYYRAKAVGSGTVYGSGLSFTTLPASNSNPNPDPGPVSVAGTFGLNNGNNTYNQPANGLQAMRFQNTAGTGTLNKLELLVNDSTPAGKVRMGIFADSNGRPGARLLDAGEATVTNGWVSISNLNLPVVQGAYYWLAFNLQSANTIPYQGGQAGSHYWAAGITYGALPTSYPSSGSVGSNTSQFVMRATVAQASNSNPNPNPDPVSVAGTFGLNNGNNTYNQPANGLQAMRFQNTAGTGTLNKLELLVNDSTPAGKVRMGIFADSNGRPGARLLDAGEATVTNGWVSISNLNLPVVQGAYYWLAFNLQSANTIPYQGGQAGSHYWAAGITYGALPTSYPSSGSVGSNTSQFVMRATVISNQ